MPKSCYKRPNHQCIAAEMNIFYGDRVKTICPDGIYRIESLEFFKLDSSAPASNDPPSSSAGPLLSHLDKYRSSLTL